MHSNSSFGMALHSLLIVSEFSRTQKVTSDFVAKMLGTNPVTVRNLFSKLKKAGFIKVAPRKEKEGTILCKSLKEITLADVLATVEPNGIKNIIEPNVRLANLCHAGVYLNEIIFEYIGALSEVARQFFASITLADTLASLQKREVEGPYQNTRGLFPRVE